MKKTLLCAGILLSALIPSQPLSAQILAGSVPEFPLPTIPGPVLRPQNAGSSTMQDVFYAATGTNNNLYVHCWDVNSYYNYHGIAWRRTDMGGGLQDEGFLQLDYTRDIDVALFEAGGRHYVLAGYYYDDGTAARGHYYDIYEFTPTGLVAASTMNVLTYSSVFGRINVDANTPNGLAITWSIPGKGIFVKVATMGGVVGPNVFIPGSENYKDPDVCIGRYAGNLAVYVTYRNNAEDEILTQQLDFNNVLGGTAAGMILEHTAIASPPGLFGIPRIDCPDDFPFQKWSYVYSYHSPSGGSSFWETIQAVVKNQSWSAFPIGWGIHFGSYVGSFQENNPVLAYNNNADLIHVGWITNESTTAIPNNTDAKYVAEDISDPAGGAPAPVFSSFMMISNAPAGPAPVLAFSGQDNASNFSGLHAAYSQWNTFFTSDYSMVYKDKPWSTPNYKLAAGQAPEIVAGPNPFTDKLSLQLPLKGQYNISISGTDGRKVYEQSLNSEAMQQTGINTGAWAPGVYFLQISSPENQVSFTRQIQKQ